LRGRVFEMVFGFMVRWPSHEEWFLV